MDGDSLVFRNSTRRGWGYICFGLFFIVIVSVPYLSSHDGPADAALFLLCPVVIFGSFGLLLIGNGIALVMNRAPKLTVDGRGITDHACRGGERHFAWSSIEGVEWRTTGQTGSLGGLILYVREDGSEVITHTICASNLEGGPGRVGTEVKRLWLRVAPQDGGARTESSTESGSS